MNITVSQQQGKVPVSIIELHGDVDASNYLQLINLVKELSSGGAQDFIIDLSDVPFMSSAGLVALHSIAIMMRGEKPTDPKAGWAALKAMDRSRDRGMQKHVKVFNPQKYVAETFEKAGFTQFFEVFTDLNQAVSSF
jgi:anti-anti-sigma regulatory factor